MCLTETKIDDLASTGSFSLSDFYIERKDRNSHGGGVMTFIRSWLKPTQLLDIQTRLKGAGIEATATEIYISKNYRIALIGLYRPPSSRTEWFSKLNKILEDLIHRGYRVILLGDINANLLDHNLTCTRSLLQSLSIIDADVLNPEPTRVTSTTRSCLDIIAIPRDLKFFDYSTLSLAVSDHFPVTTSIPVYCDTALQPFKKRTLNSENIQLIGKLARSIDIKPDTISTVDDKLNIWLSSMTVILDKVAPLKNHPYRKHAVPWITADIRKLMKERDYVASKMKYSNVDQPELAQRLCILKKIVKSHSRSSSRAYGEKSLVTKDRKSSWKFIRKSLTLLQKGLQAA